MDKPIGLFSETSLNGPRDVHQYYRDLAEQIRLGDETGFDFFSMTQSYGLDFDDSTFSISPNPIGFFASQAALTRRIRILTGIFIAPFHHPAIALSEAAAVDVMTEGRVMLGIGRGHPWLYDRLGMKQSESRGRLKEFLEMASAILDDPEGRHTHQGEFWAMQDFQLLPRFHQKRPDLWVAITGGAESALEAARHRAGIIFPSYLGVPIEEIERVNQSFQAEYQKLWGEPGRFFIGIHTYVDDDHDLAISRGRVALAGQLKVFARNIAVGMADRVGDKYPVYREFGNFFTAMSDPETCERMVAEQWPRLLAIWGNRDSTLPRFRELIERIRPHGLILNIDAGGLPHPQVLSATGYLGRHILPELRDMMRRTG